MRYCCRAYNDGQGNDPNARVIPRFVSANSLSSLRWWEDAFGQEHQNCRAVNWDTVPNLDCVVACVLERAHSRSGQHDPVLLQSHREGKGLCDTPPLPMEKWISSKAGLEYREGVSEWLRDARKLYQIAKPEFPNQAAVTQGPARQALQSDAARQILAPRPRSLGKSAAEGPTLRRMTASSVPATGKGHTGPS